ncbi:Hypothetical protein FKW44_012958, partial [Caligus rogercresseyi]
KRNMDTPQHAKDRAAIKAVSFPVESGPKTAKESLLANKAIATVCGMHAV